MTKLETVAAEISKLGRKASVITAGRRELLKVEGSPVRSPVVRGERLVWGERSYTNPATLAAAIVDFLSK